VSRSTPPLRAKRDKYELARLAVTVIGGLAGVVAGMLAELGVPGVIATGAVGAAAGIGAGTAVAKRIFSEVMDPLRAAAAARAEADHDLAVVLYHRAGVSPLQNADPYSIGVLHSAAADEQQKPNASRPPYFERAIDKTLRRDLAVIGARGGVVVVAGHPKAGKSRTLFEALATSPATRDRTLYALRPPDKTEGVTTTRAFDTLLNTPMDIDGPNSVLWVDDAQAHFPYGLTLARLEELLERYRGVIVAMTVHTDQLQPPPRTSEAGELTSVDRLLLDHLWELAQGHILATPLTAEEQTAARHEYADLSASIEYPIDFARLPSWLAGVDYLRRRYHAAGPELYGGVAVARAAINWRRAGMPAGINDAQLRQLAELARDELDDGAAFTKDTYRKALEWAKGRDAASEPRWHGIALLRPVPGTKETLWRDYDAVTTWVTGGPNPDPPLSHKTWDAILEHVTAETAIPVGVAAYDASELEVAIVSHRMAPDNPEAMSNLGLLLVERAGEGDFAEAERLLRSAATEHDHFGAMVILAGMLEERAGEGDLAEAQQWSERARQLKPDRARGPQ
jgi:hypothetical protein